ncbi:unnamed protein product [Arabis nemorensis]|uniref:NYN domain-containing protein n=1 Tax=Arabis nemorensis TaxID=586526 RepID=A0A565BFM0_9BRAS|nr:unnamed protein product [Arabis nemorensis]
MKMASPEEADAVTQVFWNLNECMVPRGVDPRKIGPYIKRFVESYGYMGPLTITAFGVLTGFPDSILRGLYSGGINLSHVPAGHMDNISDHITLFTETEPAQANIISISEPDPGLSSWFGHMMGYNFLQPFSSYHVSFMNFLLEAASSDSEEDSEAETVDSAYWECFVCNRDPPAKGFENLKTHLDGEEHQELMLNWLPTSQRSYASPPPRNSDSHLKELPFMSIPLPPTEPTEIDHKAVTCVFWDIIKCPVPPGSDARLVGPSIKRFLETSGYSGPLTITAVGVLTQVPIDILRGVCSSGIALVNVPYGSGDIQLLRAVFAKNNPPPANFVIISDPDSDFPPAPRYGHLLLPSLPTDVGEPDDDKCSETGACSCHVCSAGYLGHSFQNFEDFATHLSSRAHQRRMLDYVPRNVRVSGQRRT